MVLAACLLSAAISPAALPSALRASGVEAPAETARLSARFESIVSDIERRTASRPTDLKRAARAHRLLHERVFRRYRVDADGIDGLLDRGEFNCVSAALFEGLVLERLGIDAKVVAGPRHVFLRVTAEERVVDVEATASRGFDVRRDPERLGRFLLAYKLATEEEVRTLGAKAVFDQYLGVAPPVDLSTAVAFLWDNRAQRLLEGGMADGVAEAFLEAHRVLPDLARSSPATAAGLARAFLLFYEAGRFEEAYRVATIDLEIYPGATSAQDRLFAAAARRVDAAADAGLPAVAEAILDDAGRLAPSAKAKLERELVPRVAAAAVRVGDWERAARLATRFASVEPDVVEARRLVEWVESRRLDSDDTSARALKLQ